MPGCSCEKDQQRDMYLSSYDDVVEQIKATTPTLADHDVRVQAAQLFRPRYHQDRISEVREAANLPEYDVGHFTVTDNGDIKYLEYGKTLEEMHQSQIRQRSHEYSAKEHQTSRMIQEAFKNGATVVTTVYPRAGDDHRDILVMRYDPNSRIGVASIITATAGQGGSLDAIHRVARNRFLNLSESKSADKVFILSDATVPTRRGEEVLHEVQQTVREVDDIKSTEQRGYWRRKAINIFESKIREKNRNGQIDEHPVLHHEESFSHLEIRPKSINKKLDQIAVEEYRAVTNFSAKVGDKIVLDTKTTLVAAGAFALESLKKRKKNDGEKAPVSIVDKFRLIFTDKTDPKTSDVIGDKQLFNFGHLKEMLHHADQRVLEAGKQFVPRVAVRWQEMMAVKSLFAFATESGVGIGVALLGLKLMTRKMPEMSRLLKLKVNRVNSREEFSLRSNNTEQNRPSLDKIVLKHQFVKKEKRAVKVLLPVVDALKRKFIKKSERQLSLKEKKVRAAKPVEQLRKTLYVLSRRLERLKKRSLPRKESMQTQRIIEIRRQETVVQFSFAWTLWALLSLPRIDTVRQNLSVLPLKKNEGIESPELLAEREPKPWILLAIIWYLSMIRESGFGNKPINQYANITNTTNKQRQSSLLPQGVIFAYAQAITS